MPEPPTTLRRVSRRERLRAEVTEQIIEIGRRQLEEGGVANVNWRAIAKEIGMNPASLYTYVDGINDLYTRVLGRSFRSLADTIAEAARAASDAAARTQLINCAQAYRTWAVANPKQFNLIFTNQIPGYTAPTHGEAFDAAMEVNTPFMHALVDLVAESRMNARTELSPEQTAIGYEFRSLMHGFTILEINQHAPYVNGSDTMMIAALNRVIDALTPTRTSTRA